MFTNTQEPPVNNLSLGPTNSNMILKIRQPKKRRNLSSICCIWSASKSKFSIDHQCLAWIVSAPDILYMMGGPTWSRTLSPDEVRLNVFRNKTQFYLLKARPSIFLTFMQTLPSLFYVLFRTFLKLLKEG